MDQTEQYFDMDRFEAWRRASKWLRIKECYETINSIDYTAMDIVTKVLQRYPGVSMEDLIKYEKDAFLPKKFDINH